MNRRKIMYIGILFIVTVIVSITYFSYAFITRRDEYHRPKEKWNQRRLCGCTGRYSVTIMSTKT